MPLGTGRAPGKVILFGEHAVVYGRPALAVPVSQVWAEAHVEALSSTNELTIWAQDLGEKIALSDAPADHPLASAVRLTLGCLGIVNPPAWQVCVHSTIPIASGLGSGAAVSAAIVRAVASAASQELPLRTVSDLVYEVDRLHHGTPSGVDNTVVAYEQPVYFVRGQPPQPFTIGRPFLLAIADSGIASPTRIAVGDVRRRWTESPERYEAVFDRIAAVVEAAHRAIAVGEAAALGPLMDVNHQLLVELGVSCEELDRLAAAARDAGAGGAKLSGGGRGGNLIALVTDRTAAPVESALRQAGALNVIVTRVDHGLA